MSGWQPPQYDPRMNQGQAGGQPGWPREYPSQQYDRQQGAVQPYAPQAPQQYAQAVPQQQYASMQRKTSTTAAEQFWYILGCISFGAAYFAKVPAKKVLSDFGLAEMTGAEKFWYVLMCIPFGAGYFAKISIAKAVSEMPQFQAR